MVDLDNHIKPKAARAIEDSWRNDAEAHELLDMIVAEWMSDPTSVQCFDLRIVERAKFCVAKRKAIVKSGLHL